MHWKLTKHGRSCVQNNQLPTKSFVELEKKSIIEGSSICSIMWSHQILHTRAEGLYSSLSRISLFLVISQGVTVEIFFQFIFFAIDLEKLINRSFLTFSYENKLVSKEERRTQNQLQQIYMILSAKFKFATAMYFIIILIWMAIFQWQYTGYLEPVLLCKIWDSVAGWRWYCNCLAYMEADELADELAFGDLPRPHALLALWKPVLYLWVLLNQQYVQMISRDSPCAVKSRVSSSIQNCENYRTSHMRLCAWFSSCL